MKNLPVNDHNQGIFFHKLWHFFPIFEKGQGRPPPLLPSSYAPEEEPSKWPKFTVISSSQLVWLL